MNKIVGLVAFLVLAGIFPVESKSIAETLRTRLSLSPSPTKDEFVDLLDPSHILHIFDVVEQLLIRVGDNMEYGLNGPLANISIDLQTGIANLNAFVTCDAALKADFVALSGKLVTLQTSTNTALKNLRQDFNNALIAMNSSIGLASAELKIMNAPVDNIFKKVKDLGNSVSRERLYDCIQVNLLAEMKSFTKVANLSTSCVETITNLFNAILAADKLVGANWNKNYNTLNNNINTCLAGATTLALVNALPATKKTAMDKCLKAITLTEISKIPAAITAISTPMKTFGSSATTCIKITLATAFLSAKTSANVKIACLESKLEAIKRIG